MSMAQLMGVFMNLQKEVDTEALSLLAKFGDRAIQSGNPKEFLKGVLRAVVETPESTQPQRVSVMVLPAKGKTSGRK